MAWRRPGDKPLSEPIMLSVSTHICVARPQWVNRQLGHDTCCSACHVMSNHVITGTHCIVIYNLIYHNGLFVLCRIDASVEGWYLAGKLFTTRFYPSKLDYSWRTTSIKGWKSPGPSILTAIIFIISDMSREAAIILINYGRVLGHIRLIRQTIVNTYWGVSKIANRPKTIFF